MTCAFQPTSIRVTAVRATIRASLDRICLAGQCILSCGGGTTLCGDRCVDLAVDPDHCGDCQSTCAAGQVCSESTCSDRCLGAMRCGDRCVDLSNDPKNCGACQSACFAGQVCSQSTCSDRCLGGTRCGDRCVDLSNESEELRRLPERVRCERGLLPIDLQRPLPQRHEVRGSLRRPLE